MGRLTYFLEPATSAPAPAVPVNLAFAAAAAARASWASVPKERGDDIWDLDLFNDGAPDVRTLNRDPSVKHARSSGDGSLILGLGDADESIQRASSNGLVAWFAEHGNLNSIPRNSMLYRTTSNRVPMESSLPPAPANAPSAKEVANVMLDRRVRSTLSQHEELDIPLGARSFRRSFMRSTSPTQGLELTNEQRAVQSGTGDRPPSSYMKASFSNPYTYGGLETVGSAEGLPSNDADADGDQPYQYGSDRDGCLVLPVLRTLLAMQDESSRPGTTRGAGAAAGGSGGTQSYGSPPTFSRQPSQPAIRASGSAVVLANGGGGGGANLIRQPSSVLPRRRAMLAAAAAAAGDASRLSRQPYSRSFHSYPGPAVALPGGAAAQGAGTGQGAGTEPDNEPVTRALSYSAAPPPQLRPANSGLGRSMKRASTITGFTLQAQAGVGGGAAVSVTAAASDVLAPALPVVTTATGGQAPSMPHTGQGQQAPPPQPQPPQQQPQPPQQASGSRAASKAQGRSKALFSWTQKFGKGKWPWLPGRGGGGRGASGSGNGSGSGGGRAGVGGRSSPENASPVAVPQAAEANLGAHGAASSHTGWELRLSHNGSSAITSQTGLLQPAQPHSPPQQPLQQALQQAQLPPIEHSRAGRRAGPGGGAHGASESQGTNISPALRSRR